MSIPNRTLKALVKYAKEGDVNIPEIQRDFVWKPSDLLSLLSSLYRKYPIGTLLTWDSGDAYESSRVTLTNPRYGWIIDGQQRTTALCLAFGLKPDWWDHDYWNSKLEQFDIQFHLGHSEGKEFALPAKKRSADPSYVSVRKTLMCRDEDELMRLAKTVAEASGITEMVVHAALYKIWTFGEREVPVISIDHPVEDVAEIFARVNEAGTRVKEADVILSLIAAYNAGWVRGEFLPFCQEIEEKGFDLEPGVLLKTMAGIKAGTARIKDIPKKTWREEIDPIWDDLKRAVSGVIIKSRAKGLTNARLVPSSNSFIPLFALFAKYDEGLDFDRAFRWFLVANSEGRYSGAPNQILTEDLGVIHAEADPAVALDQLEGKLGAVDPLESGYFRRSYLKDKFGRLLLSLLLFSTEAADWHSNTRISMDSSGRLLEGYSPEWHHIYPKSQLERAGKTSEEINQWANITYMTKQTNRNRIRYAMPEVYLSELNVTSDQRTAHFVPSDMALSLSEFESFCEQRATRIAEAANGYLGLPLNEDAREGE